MPRTLTGSSLANANGGTINTGSLIGWGVDLGPVDLSTTITNEGNITVSGSAGMGEVLNQLLSSDALNVIPEAGKTLISGLLGDSEAANLIKVGYVQASGMLDNQSTGKFDAAGLSGLIGATVKNDGTLGFDTLVSLGSTINNNAGGQFSADNLYLLGGTLTNNATDKKDDEDKLTHGFVVDSLIAIGSKDKDGNHQMN